MNDLVPAIVKTIFTLPDMQIVLLMRFGTRIAGIIGVNEKQTKAISMLIKMKKKSPRNWKSLKQTINKSDTRQVSILLKSIMG